MPRARIAAIAAFCSAAVLGAYGNIAHAATGGVSIVDRSFAPAYVRVEPGDDVLWTHNDGTREHNVTATGFASSATMTQGQTHRVTFNTAGTFSYRCTFHGGMTGTVQVGPPPSTTTAPPPPPTTTTAKPPTTTTTKPTTTAKPAPTTTAKPGTPTTTAGAPGAGAPGTTSRAGTGASTTAGRTATTSGGEDPSAPSGDDAAAAGTALEATGDEEAEVDGSDGPRRSRPVAASDEAGGGGAGGGGAGWVGVVAAALLAGGGGAGVWWWRRRTLSPPA